MLKGVLARGNIFMRLECTEVASFMSNLKQAQRFKHDTCEYALLVLPVVLWSQVNISLIE